MKSHAFSPKATFYHCFKLATSSFCNLKLKTDKCAINKHEKSRSYKKNIGTALTSVSSSQTQKWPKYSGSFNTYKLFPAPTHGEGIPTYVLLRSLFSSAKPPRWAVEISAADADIISVQHPSITKALAEPEEQFNSQHGNLCFRGLSPLHLTSHKNHSEESQLPHPEKGNGISMWNTDLKIESSCFYTKKIN